jgi:hypothetical protein
MSLESLRKQEIRINVDCVWGHMPVISTLWRLRQEDHEI